MRILVILVKKDKDNNDRLDEDGDSSKPKATRKVFAKYCTQKALGALSQT